MNRNTVNGSIPMARFVSTEYKIYSEGRRTRFCRLKSMIIPIKIVSRKRMIISLLMDAAEG